MKKLLLFLAITTLGLFTVNKSFAQYTYQAGIDNSWTDPDAWDFYPGTNVNGYVTITYSNCIISTNVTVNGDLLISSGLVINAGDTLTVTGTLTVGGGLTNYGVVNSESVLNDAWDDYQNYVFNTGIINCSGVFDFENVTSITNTGTINATTSGNEIYLTGNTDNTGLFNATSAQISNNNVWFGPGRIKGIFEDYSSYSPFDTIPHADTIDHFTGNGTIWINVAGTAGPGLSNGNDMVVMDTADLWQLGNILIVPESSYKPQLNDSFRIIEFNNLISSPEEVNYQFYRDGWQLSLLYYSDHIEAVVTPNLYITNTLDTVYQPGATFNVDFSNDNANYGDSIQAWLSDANGSFADSTEIGSIFNDAASGTIPATIPNNMPFGSHYRIRITSTSPVEISPDNGHDITIGSPCDIQLTSLGSSDVSAYGCTDGMFTLSATTGEAELPYTVYVNNDSIITVPSISPMDMTGLAAGTYHIKIVSGACTDTLSVTINQPSCSMVAGIGKSDVTNYGCNDGRIDIIGYTNSCSGNYTVYINNSNVGSAGSGGEVLIQNLSAGIDTINVVSDGGCNYSQIDTINQPANTISVYAYDDLDVSSYGCSDGSINVEAGGSDCGQTFELYINGSDKGSYLEDIGNEIDNLTAGAYGIKVVSSTGATDSTTVTVSQPSCSTNLSASGTDVSNYGCSDGSIDFSGYVSDCSGYYSLYVNNSFYGSYASTNGSTLTNLSPGDYHLAIFSGTGGCADSTVVTIGQPSCTVSASINPLTQVSSYGCSDASIDVTGYTNTCSGGYTVYMNGVNVGSGISGSDVLIQNLSARVDTIDVVSDGGCSSSQIITIGQPACSMSASINPSTQVSSYGCSDASIDVTGYTNSCSGGYTVYMNGINVGSGISGFDVLIQNLSAGVDTINVVSDGGCSYSQIVTIGQPGNSISVNATLNQDVSAYGCSDGSLTVSASGSDCGQSFELYINGVYEGDFSENTGNEFDNLTAGRYGIKVVSSTGATDSTTVTISQPSCSLTVTVNKSDVSTYGCSDGRIDVKGNTNSCSGGYTVYMNGTNVGTSGSGSDVIIQNLSAGMDTINVVSDGGCSYTQIDTINQPACSASISVIPIGTTAYGCSNGELYITGYVQDCSGTYTLYINGTNNGSYTTNTGPHLTGLTGGNYQIVIVSGSGGCSDTVNETISQPVCSIGLITGVGYTSHYGCSDGSIAVGANVSDCTGTFTAYVNGENIGTFPSGDDTTITNLPAGTYHFKAVTGTGGCSDSTDIVVEQPDCSAGINYSKTDASGGLCNNGILNIYGYADNCPDIYAAFVNGQFIETSTSGIPVQVTGLAAGTYHIKIVTVSGCADSMDAVIGLQDTARTIIANGPTTFCAGGSVTLTAPSSFIYAWSNGDGSQSITVNQSGKYSLIRNGCVASDTITVTVNSLPTVTTNTDSVAVCNPATTTLTASGALTYTWSPSTGLSDTQGSSVLSSGTPGGTVAYTVTGTDENGCSNTAIAKVRSYIQPGIKITPGTPSICQGSSVVINLQGSGAYSWSPAISLSSSIGSSVTASPTATTTYTIVGTTGPGCTVTKNMTVTVKPLPSLHTTPGSANICNGNSVNLSASGAATYAWTPSAGLNTTSGSAVTASPTVSTSYTITGTAINGCTNFTTIWVNVNSGSAISISPARNSICPGSSATLTASGALTYTWSPATGLSATTGSDVTASPTVTTSYTVAATNSNGCASSGNVTVNVKSGTGLKVIPVNAMDCPGSTINLKASGAALYAWSPSTALSATTGSTVIATPTVTTTYRVVGTGKNGCSGEDSVTITIGCTRPTNLAVTTVTDTSADLSWNAQSCATGFKIKYRVNGTKAWTIVNITGFVTNYHIGGLTSGVQYDWQVFTNCGGTSYSTAATSSFTTIGVRLTESNSSDDNLLLYPNPASNATTVEFSIDASSVQLNVVNILGQVVYTQQVTPYNSNDYRVNLDLSKLQSGLYEVVVKTGDVTLQKKLIKAN